MQSDVQFDQQEAELMFSTSVFPLKRQINRKLYLLFEQIKNALKDTPIHQNFSFPAGTDTTTGKISQGENHQEFPWVMLDFPKLFTQDRIFAYRTLFWYGTGFSNAIVIGGELCESFSNNLLRNRHMLTGKGVYFSLAADPWDHLVNGPDTALIEIVSDVQITEHIHSTKYMKLSCGYTNLNTDQVIRSSVENYRLFLSVLL